MILCFSYDSRIPLCLVFWAHDWIEKVGIQTPILLIKHNTT
jgi:hypothetical protein